MATHATKIHLSNGIIRGSNLPHVATIYASRKRIQVAIETGLQNDGFEACSCGAWFDPQAADAKVGEVFGQCPRCGTALL